VASCQSNTDRHGLGELAFHRHLGTWKASRPRVLTILLPSCASRPRFLVILLPSCASRTPVLLRIILLPSCASRPYKKHGSPGWVLPSSTSTRDAVNCACALRSMTCTITSASTAHKNKPLTTIGMNLTLSPRRIRGMNNQHEQQ
jgi:hypothetical protein